MLNYNFKAISKAAKGNCDTIVKLLKLLCGIKKHPNREEYLMLGKLKNKELDSYILNPAGLLNNNYSSNDICIYVMLASKRSYARYISNGDSSLPIYVVNDIINIEKLKNNMILDIDDTHIHFRY